MPNWCNNELMIFSDDDSLIEDFLNQAKPSESDSEEDNKILLFKNFIPMPESEPDWYHWNIENWGTKWEPLYAELVGRTDGYVCITFDTAWTPPVEAISRIAEDRPDMKFVLKYDEPGMCFMGVAIANNCVLVDNCLSYEG